MYRTIIAYLLWLVSGCGVLGFHRFYLNKIGTGLLWFFTGGLGFFGAAYDFFTLPFQVKEANLRLQYRQATLELEGAGGAVLAEPKILRRRMREEKKLRHSKDSVEQVILKTARRNQGIATPAEVALAGEIGIDHAKKILEKLAQKGYAQMQVTKGGAIVYFFPDFSPSGSHPKLEEI